jgi:co-chaperonin GroES (HSP10)
MKKELTFKPSIGSILVDPLVKSKKSDMMDVPDSVDDPHSGIVIAVGGDKPFEGNPKVLEKAPVKVGDFILYSIVGCEKTKMFHKGNLRHEFVIVPFARVLGIRLDKDKIS